jgi:hypothetical protein
VTVVQVPRITAQVTRPTTAEITAAPTHLRLTAVAPMQAEEMEGAEAETVAVVMEEGIDS